MNHRERLAQWPLELASVAMLTLAAIQVTGCERHVVTKTEASGPPIYFLTVDTVRADHLPIYGYTRDTAPNLTGLVADAVVFTRAFTTAPLTVPAYASAFTGLYPHRHGARATGQELASAQTTLAELLAARGYDTAGVVSSTVMLGRLSGLSKGFGLWDDQFTRDGKRAVSHERSARATVETAMERFAQLRQPVFLFVHLIDPHGPYTPPMIHRKHYIARKGGYLDGIAVPSYQTIQGARVIGDYVDAYDAEIRYADAELGRLLDSLRTSGQYDRALVIFTSDHGESFGEDGVYFEHDGTLHEATTRIPLVIKPPGGRPSGVSSPWDGAVSLVDLLPTILDYAGVHTPPALDGTSLRPVLEGHAQPGGRWVFSQRWTARGGHWGIHGTEGSLYVVDCDPAQAVTTGCPDTYLARRADGNVVALAATTETRARLRTKLEGIVSQARAYRLPFEVPTRHVAGAEAEAGGVGEPYDPRDAESLRKLGYLD